MRRVRRGLRRQTAFAPSQGRTRKQEGGVAVGFPPVAQLGHHRRGQGHEPILAALAAADVQAGMRRGRVPEIAQFNADGLADPQAGVIDQAQHGAIARELHRLEQAGDLFARQHQRQRLRRSDAEFLEHRPGQAELEVFAEETAEGAFGDLHGGGPELPDLAQFEIIGADLILGERGRVALVMVAEAADVADVFFLGGSAKIFELDKRAELCNGWSDQAYGGQCARERGITPAAKLKNHTNR